MKKWLISALSLIFVLALVSCVNSTDTQKLGNDYTTIPVMENTVREIRKTHLQTGVELSDTDEEIIAEIIDNGTWMEKTPNCSMNCSINLKGRLYYYHSDCGTLEEFDVSEISYLSSKIPENHNKSLKLSDTEKDTINAVLEKYIF